VKPATGEQRPGHQAGSRSIVWELRWLVLSAVLPMVVLVFVQTYLSYREANNAAQEFVQRQAARVVNDVTSFLVDTERGLRLMAERPGVVAMDPAHCDPGLGDLISIEPRYANVNVIDRQGWVICGATPAPGGPRSVNVSDRDWFQAVMAGKAFALGKVRQGPILGRWVSTAAVPVAGAGGTIAGMVVTAIDLQRWSSEKGPINILPADSVLGAMEKTGRLVLRSPEADKWVGRDTSKEKISSTLLSTGDGVFVSAGVQGFDRVWAVKPIPGTEWIAFAGLRSDTVLAAPRREAATSLGFILVLLLTVAALTRKASMRLARSISDLASTAARVAVGDRTVRAKLSGPAEIDEVAQEFNHMLDQSDRSTQALRTSEARLREAQHNAHIGSWFYQPPATFEWSDEVYELFKLPRGGPITFDAIKAVVHPSDRDGRYRQAFLRAVESGAPNFEAESRIVWPDGQIRTVVVLGKLRRDQDGRLAEATGTVQDVTERKAAEEQIQALAFSDPLTNLPNRRLLMDRLDQALTAAYRHVHQAALLFIDMDNFKTLNDTLGHDKGDSLLKQVAQRLTACVREGDTVARLGGDEFVVLLEDLNGDVLEAATQAQVVASKILGALGQPYDVGGNRHHSTASIGVTLFGGGDRESIEEPLKRSELAMYQAKAAGRNTLRFFEPEMRTAVTTRATLEAELREAVSSGQFVLHYQPQGGDESRLNGAEALLRWRHPQRGLVSPAEFIPVAEASGLILPMGRWVLETACKQLATWAARPEMAQLIMAVNVSARQFRQPDFVEAVLTILSANGAKPERLKIELTESVLVDNVEDVIVKMNALKAKGVGFSIDDFGTGYSSLSYLKRLPLDQLKIDQGFIRDILTDPDDAAIAKMVVALADSLGLSVIAEGVETEAQREFLASLGCHNYQGYLFSKPLSIQEFEKFAAQVLSG